MSLAGQPHFRPALFTYLRDLEKNNNRDWFNDNKQRFLDNVRDPALQFISDFGPRLEKISPHFKADPRPSGGSLFRIYRDVRFSKDKSPYKTWVAVQFRHKQGKDVHAPGFYLHLAPGNVLAGVGIWRPDGPSLKKIRDAIAADPARWKRLMASKGFSRFKREGDRLKRPPKGYDAEHPLIEDLKYKDFIGMAKLTQKAATSADFLSQYTKLCRSGAPVVKFLSEALDVPF